MKLLIFGATGLTGRHLVDQALKANHTVTAFARNPVKLEIKHPNLRIVQGDVMEMDSIERAMPGQDAVLSVLGDGDKKSTLRSEGTRRIMESMKKAGITRFVSTSTLGIRDTRTILPPLYTYFLVPFILKHAFNDHARQEELIERSNLDWTIVRPAALTNGPLTGNYHHGFPVTQKGLKLKISRADVAEFILKQVNNNLYIRKAPGISY